MENTRVTAAQIASAWVEAMHRAWLDWHSDNHGWERAPGPDRVHE